MAGISTTGIGSGLDINGLVEQLVAAERQPAERRYNAREVEYQAQLSGFGLVKSALSELRTALGSLGSEGLFQQRSATSAEPDIFTATARDGVAAGSYSVEVEQLATAQRLRTGGFTNAGSTVGTGTLSISANGTGFSVDVTGGTLTEVRDAINGAAAAVFPALLERLGVQWCGVNTSCDGNFTHNPEPRPDHLGELSELCRKSDACRGGFAFDPDADRLAPMGENGEPLSEELTLTIALDGVLSRSPSCIATNLSTSMIIDDVARKHGVTVFRSKIGEANVVEKLLENNCLIGGEGNGGVIFPQVSTVRDGPAALALILETMARQNKKLSELAAQWPVYELIKEKFPCEKGDPRELIERLAKKFSAEKTDTQDGLKIIRDTGWVHVRPSNTEPIIRCYAEAKSREEAQQLVDMIAREI